MVLNCFKNYGAGHGGQDWLIIKSLTDSKNAQNGFNAANMTQKRQYWVCIILSMLARKGLMMCGVPT